MSNTPLFYRDNDSRWEDLGDGVSRKISGYDDKIMLVKVKFEVGAIGPLHNHYHSQVTYVASGVFEVTIDGNKEVLSAGDSFYAPPNDIHGVLCIEAGVLVDVFSPMREDFLG
ncbi:cupin domain-containing protein [Daejeonella lutea]|uniref:Cupin domain-containing protein n=1 Tax=Daejeonella lutea TaxID=572036 RepID=A0A1T5ARL7_9SPHI|nr:cupin domain-containing protein [Daejeonella lutea]SKB37470.1 Cupin domain-containing protein [Daejeonella lutea]